MKKRVSNEEVAQAINIIAEKIRSDLDYNFRVAQSQLQIAENDLVDSLDEKQKKLYEEFAKKEANFTKSQKRFIKENFSYNNYRVIPYLGYNVFLFK